jgi:methionyl aminopeptidase
MITIKTQKEIESMRRGGNILAGIMEKLGEKVTSGTNTKTLDKLAEELVFAAGGVPAFKGYGAETGNPFPATLCTSLNSEVVHAIPSEKVILKDGDILKIDVGMKYKGMFTDMTRIFAIGKISDEARKLIEVTEGCFWAGIKNLKAGVMLSDYSKAAQKYVESHGFSVVRNLVGHGIGRELHEDPYVPNYYDKKYQDIRLSVGMALALEPMVNVGKYATILDNDGWVFVTKDGSLSAQYENTIIITEKGVEVITLSD